MKDSIRTLITKYEEPGDFTYAKATDSELELAEKELNLTLPSQYVKFLKTYGHGGICAGCPLRYRREKRVGASEIPAGYPGSVCFHE